MGVRSNPIEIQKCWIKCHEKNIPDPELYKVKHLSNQVYLNAEYLSKRSF